MDMVGVGDNVIYVTKEGAMAVEVGSTKGEAVDISHDQQGQETDVAEPKVSSDNPKSSRGKTRKRKSGVTSSKSVKTPRKGRSTKTESKIDEDGEKKTTALPSPRPSRPRRPLDLTRRRTNLLTILVQLIPARRIRNQVHRQVLPPRTSFHKCRFQALCLGPLRPLSCNLRISDGIPTPTVQQQDFSCITDAVYVFTIGDSQSSGTKCIPRKPDNCSLPFLNVFSMTGPSSNRESNPQILLVSVGSPLSSPFTISSGYHQEPQPQAACRM